MEPQIQLTVHCQVIVRHQSGTIISPLIVPVVSPSRDGDVTVYVWHKPTQLAHSFLFCSRVYFCLYGPLNCILFHKFSRQLSAFSLCFFRSHFCLVGPFNCMSLYQSLLQPWYNPLWLTGLKAPTNWLTSYSRFVQMVRRKCPPLVLSWRSFVKILHTHRIFLYFPLPYFKSALFFLIFFFILSIEKDLIATLFICFPFRMFIVPQVLG